MTANTAKKVDALLVTLRHAASNANAHIRDFGHVEMTDCINVVRVKLLKENVKEIKQKEVVPGIAKDMVNTLE